jgi:hypothetical protein
VPGDFSKDLTLFDKLKLYPDIVMDESISVNRNDLQKLLDRVKSPGEGDNIGVLLEDLSKLFLDSPYLKFNCARRRCKTGEIDLDFTVKKFETTLFYEFSYLLIVECKNLKEKASASDLRTFCSKMRDVDSSVGIFFSKKGITKDAKGVIQDSWIRDKIVVIVFTLDDIEKIVGGSARLYEILNKKYLAVRTASTE